MEDPPPYTLLGGLLARGFTALGAAIASLTQEPSRKPMDGMLGSTAGVMLSAPSPPWSPECRLPWVPAAVGPLAGGVTMRLLDHLLPHLHLGFPMEAREGTRVPWRRATLQVLAITLHNTPKGLAVAWPLKRAGVRAGPARFYG